MNSYEQLLFTSAVSRSFPLIHIQVYATWLVYNLQTEECKFVQYAWFSLTQPCYILGANLIAIPYHSLHNSTLE